jgi:hypothetical protein
LQDIAVWEQEMITTIQAVATEKRNEAKEPIRAIHNQLRQYLHETTAQQQEKKIRFSRDSS